MDGIILDDIIRSLGPILGDDFNNQILGLIDTTLMDLTQVGCLKPITESVTESTTWAEILFDPPFIKQRPEDINVVYAVKQYIYIKVKILLDPPASGLVSVLEEQANRLLWRIGVVYDSK